MEFEYITHSADETEEIGKRLSSSLINAKTERAFIAMRGEMGVGKTAFVRGFCSSFGISGVKSPTYTVVNEYRGTHRVFHFDMYRIESEDDLISIGYDDYVSADGFCIAEWSENVEELLPEDVITVTVERLPDNENSRMIKIDTTLVSEV